MRSHEWSRLLTGRDASGTHGIQMFSVRREQGRLEELAPVVRLLAGKSDGSWRPGLAALLAELGMTADAQRELRRAVFADLDRERRSLWVAALTYLTDAAAIRGEPATAERLYPELAKYRGATVIVGHLVSCCGAADRFLGMLAGVLGEWELAEEHFEVAAALNQRLGARTWLAHTTCEHGRMLLLRGRARDREAATALIEESLRLARPLGLTRVVARIRATGLAAADAAATATGLSAREADGLRLVAQWRFI